MLYLEFLNSTHFCANLALSSFWRLKTPLLLRLLPEDARQLRVQAAGSPAASGPRGLWAPRAARRRLLLPPPHLRLSVPCSASCSLLLSPLQTSLSCCLTQVEEARGPAGRSAGRFRRRAAGLCGHPCPAQAQSDAHQATHGGVEARTRAHS